MSLGDDMNGADRAKALSALATILDLPPIAAIIQRGDEKLTARYILHFADGQTLDLGGINGLWSQAEFRKAILVKLRKAPRPLERDDWTKLIENVIENAIQAEIDGERFADTIAGWLADHLDRTTSTDFDGACDMRQSFTRDGVPHVYLDDFLRYVRRDLAEQVKRPDVIRAMEDLGYERRQINYRKSSGGRSTRSYYVAQAPPGTTEQDES